MIKHAILESTTEFLSCRSGLSLLDNYLDKLNFSDLCKRYLPSPGSNRGIAPGDYVRSLSLMLNAGGEHLEDIRLLKNDRALCHLLNLDKIPSSDAIGGWLKKIGSKPHAMRGLEIINSYLLESYLQGRDKQENLTLDIDATAIKSNKYNARYTYKKFKGYMPIVGNIGDFIIGEEFREGNISPSTNNLDFIKYCLRQLPCDRKVNFIRADAASYQSDILNFCHDNNMTYFIGGKMTESLKEAIKSISDDDWKAFTDRYGVNTDSQVAAIAWATDKCSHSFTVAVIRSKLDEPDLLDGKYRYHIVATNDFNKTPEEIIHFYSLRGDKSENSIKELKIGFNMENMPCGTFEANSAFFRIGAIAYNISILFKKQILPKEFNNKKIQTIRLHIYNVAGKVVRTARRLILKANEQFITMFKNIRRNILKVPI